LVAKLNVALDLMQNATLRRLEGDQTNAARFEDQARSTLTEIMNQAPEAQQRAESESSMRTLFLLPWIPAVVLLSTFLFYAALRTWRWYEKMKLFEMEILEKKKED